MVGLPLFSSGLDGAMSDASLIALFTVGDGLNADCVVPGLLAHLPPGAGTHIDAENAASPGSDVPEAKAVKKASLITVALRCWPCR